MDADAGQPSTFLDDDAQIDILVDDHECGDPVALAFLGNSDNEFGGDDMHVREEPVLVSSEEAAGAVSRDYLRALLHSDPRAGFEAMHMGALTTIEEQEGWTRSTEELPNWLLPRVALGTEMQTRRGGGTEVTDSCTMFYIPSAQAELLSRATLARCDGAVDELLNRPSRALLSRALGGDILHTLHRHLHPLSEHATTPATTHKRRRGARKS